MPYIQITADADVQYILIKPVSDQEKREKLLAIAKMSEEGIRGLKATDLRYLATGLIPNTKAKKADLIERLIAVSAEDRANLLAESRKSEERVKPNYYGEGIDAEVLKTVTKISDPNVSVETLFEQMYGFTVEPMIANTYTPRINKWVRKNQELSDEYKTKWIEAWNATIRPYKLEVDALEKALREQEKRNTPQRRVNIESVINLSTRILSDVSERSPWKEVAFAVAIATGRRMIEILGDHSRFEKLDDNRLLFEGQVKQSRTCNYNLETYQIPTLVDADLVMAGLDRLESKRVPKDKVNGQYANQLSAGLPWGFKRTLYELGITKFKDAREFYVAVQTDIFYRNRGQSKATAADYIASIMGQNHTGRLEMEVFSRAGLDGTNDI
jgi:hypothetical protein